MLPGSNYTRIPTKTVNQRLHNKLSAAEATMCWNLLGRAGFHLRVARWGYGLYDGMMTGQLNPQTNLGETQQFVELACSNLICRSLVTCLDLCGAVAYRVSGLPPLPKNREADIGSFDKKDHRQALPAAIGAWMQALRGDNRWNLLAEWRHLASHKWVHETLTISLGGPPVPTKITIGSRQYDQRALAQQTIIFTAEQFTAFVAALEQDLI